MAEKVFADSKAPCAANASPEKCLRAALVELETMTGRDWKKKQDTAAAISDIRGWGVEFVNADWPLAQMAAEFKARHKLSYADAFAAALAKDRHASLLTGDREFRPLDAKIKIEWLR